MSHATTKTIELALPKTTLTPCILDDDPAQLDLMTEQVAILGYEAIPTSNPEEALRLIRTGALPDGICRCAYAGNERIRISGPGAAKRSGSARHRDDGQLHTGFGAGCNPPWRDGFPAEAHRSRAHEANLGRSRGVVRPASARKSAGRATLEGFGISRNRRQEPCHAGGL